MSGADTSINISPTTLERARKAKEAIEKYYVDMVKIKQERNERHRKIDQLLSQAALSEEEETKVVILYKNFPVLINLIKLLSIFIQSSNRCNATTLT